MTEPETGDDYADGIAAARDRLIAVARRCSPDEWNRPLGAGDDCRPVGVVVDHVAHAYEYLAGFVGSEVAQTPQAVSAQLIDELNAAHAAAAGDVDTTHAVDHLQRSGDHLVTLIRSLRPDQLDLGDGRVRRFAQIAIRHADAHRSEIEAALTSAR